MATFKCENTSVNDIENRINIIKNKLNIVLENLKDDNTFYSLDYLLEDIMEGECMMFKGLSNIVTHAD